MRVDLLEDKYLEWNPYHYVHNNQEELMDRDGKKADGWYEKTKWNILWVESRDKTYKGSDRTEYTNKDFSELKLKNIKEIQKGKNKTKIRYNEK